jgi:SNF2 family DNA or RNA helicase
MILKKTAPKEYQKDTIDRGASILRERGHLALAPVFMGAGKTLMSLYMAMDLNYEQIVVICPKTLMRGWIDQIIEHTSFPIDNIFYREASKCLTQKWQSELSTWLRRHPRIIIINVEAWQRKNSQLSKLLSDLQNTTIKTIIILDESSKIKHISASRTQNIINTLPDNLHKVILSGTPVAGSILNLFSQYYFLNSRLWGIFGKTLNQIYYKWRYRYAVLVDEWIGKGRTVKKVVGFKNLEELKTKISGCTIELKREDCVDLPDKIEQEVKIEMHPDHKKFYITFLTELIAEIDDNCLSVTQAIVKFVRLRQICGGFYPADDTGVIQKITLNEKLNFLLDDIEDTEDKIIIIANYHEEINLIKDSLPKDSALCYTGLQSIKERDNNLNLFKNYDNYKFLLLNPQTGSYGLNLQFCHIIYYYSLPNSTELFEQGKERIYRIGQTNKCLYKYLIYDDSIDVKLKNDLDLKQDLVSKFYSAEAIKDYLLGGKDEITLQ